MNIRSAFVLLGFLLPILAHGGWFDSDAEKQRQSMQEAYDIPGTAIAVARHYIPSGQGYTVRKTVVEAGALAVGDINNLRKVKRFSEASHWIEKITFYWTGPFEGAGKTTILHVFRLENGRLGDLEEKLVVYTDVQSDADKAAQVGAVVGGFLDGLLNP